MHGFDPHDEEACGIWDTVENSQAFHRLTSGMKYFLGAVGLTTLFLGGIGVMNVMLVAVRERTQEIGVRKAVGRHAPGIVGQFFARDHDCRASERRGRLRVRLWHLRRW